ncbi:MAG: signal peptidase II [Trichlorobacter sp.]|nr:signal peptidase II [Trichlorobacter sp.]
MMAHWRIFLLIVPTGILIDQLSKWYVHNTMSLYQSIPVIDGFFNITYLRNPGAAFSFLANTDWRIPFFIVITLVACAIILIVLQKMQHGQRLSHIALSMIFSGAIGNLIDRIRWGEVIDFLDVYVKQHHWPAFNVADSLICVGVALMTLQMFREENKV